MSTLRKTYSPAFKAEGAQEVLQGEKTISHISSQYGIPPTVIGKCKRAAVKSMPTAFDEEGRTHNQIAALKAEHEKEKELLYAEMGRLPTQLNWLKKNVLPVLPSSINMGLVERNRESCELALSTQAALLAVSRSSLYYRPVPVSHEEVELNHKIAESFPAQPY